MIWGLKHPIYSAAALQIWVLSKVWYTYGYINNGPKGVRAPPKVVSHQHNPYPLCIYSRGFLARDPMGLLRLVSSFILDTHGRFGCTDDLRGTLLKLCW